MALLNFFDESATLTFGSVLALQRLIENMDAANVSVLVYPTWSNIPELIGDYGTDTGRISSLRCLLSTAA